MCAEFSSIFQLCSEVLNSATQASLIKATLETLLRFFNWIPLGYIFETPIIDTLRTRFLEMPEFRNVTLKCLTEIGGLQTGQQNVYDEKLVQMFTEVLTTISKIIPLTLDLKSTYASSNSKDQEFIQNLALFLCNFFSVHLTVSLRISLRCVLLTYHSLLKISRTETSSPTRISTLSESRKSMTGKFSRSAWNTGPSLFRSCTTRCSHSLLPTSIRSSIWVLVVSRIRARQIQVCWPITLSESTNITRFFQIWESLWSRRWFGQKKS